MGPFDPEWVEQSSRVLGGVGEHVAAPDPVGQPVPAPGQGEHPEPVGQVRGQLGEHVGGAVQAGQQQVVTVASPVQLVKADAVEGDEPAGGTSMGSGTG